MSSGYKAIVEAIYGLEPGVIIELFELDLTTIPNWVTPVSGVEVLRFHAGTANYGTYKSQEIMWQGKIYYPYPIEVSGFEFSGKGALPTPSLKVANLTGVLTTLILDHEDLVWAKLTRKRTFAKYLDSVCFDAINLTPVEGITSFLGCIPISSGIWYNNSSMDVNAHFPDDIFYIDRKKTENRVMIEFQLSTAFDVHGTKLPRRPMISNTCTWKYKSGQGCTWVDDSTKRYNIDDIAVVNEADDHCGKRVKSCELRFGESNELPYGGFPGSNLGF